MQRRKINFLLKDLSLEKKSKSISVKKAKHYITAIHNVFHLTPKKIEEILRLEKTS